MSIATTAKKVSKYWWFALLGFCLLPFLTCYATRLDPTSVLAPIPVGSKLSELDEYMGKFYAYSNVLEWHSNRPSDSTGHRKTKYGSFYIRDLGDYESWKVLRTERGSFTGELLFFHISYAIPDDLAPSYVFSLVYVNGILKEKDYGHLPG